MSDPRLEWVASGGDCLECGAGWSEVSDLEPVIDGDEHEGGLTMQHEPDCPLLPVIAEMSATISDEVFLGEGTWQ